MIRRFYIDVRINPWDKTHVWHHDAEAPPVPGQMCEVKPPGYLGFLAGEIERVRLVAPPFDTKPILRLLQAGDIPN